MFWWECFSNKFSKAGILQIVANSKDDVQIIEEEAIMKTGNDVVVHEKNFFYVILIMILLPKKYFN